MRIYQVSNKKGDTIHQMEIRTFTSQGRFIDYFFAEGSKSRFEKRQGNFLIKNPMIIREVEVISKILMADDGRLRHRVSAVGTALELQLRSRFSA